MTTPVHYHLGKFPPAQLDWARLLPLVGSARDALGHYRGVLSAIPNAALLLSPLTTQEAVLSSKIEGTQVTMGEVLEIEAGGDGDHTQTKKDDAEEVINYRTALRMLTKSLQERPFSEHMLRETHAILLQGVRGKDKSPGAYRTDQNWIGAKTCPIEQASFVPVATEHLGSTMQQWMSFWLDEKQADPLIQLALLHVEFESIHPFKDGNGRLGRMVIPLFLYQRKLLDGPYFYMSGYLEAHREAYHEKLRAVSADDAWTDWCAFFLQGLTEQAQDNCKKATSILALYKRIRDQIVELTHSQHAPRAVDFLFQSPVFSAPQFVQGSGIPRPTALRILSLLQQSGLLYSVREGKGRRAGVFAFSELINVAEGRKIFESQQ
jgi:Fic family protein